MPHPNGMPTLQEQRDFSEEELVKRIDQQYSFGPGERHLLLAACFRDELVRREQDKTTQAILGYTREMHVFTRQMRNMTRIILGATIVSFIVACLGVLKQFSII